jgi:hypothetical protein
MPGHRGRKTAGIRHAAKYPVQPLLHGAKTGIGHSQTIHFNYKALTAMQHILTMKRMLRKPN